MTKYRKGGIIAAILVNDPSQLILSCVIEVEMGLEAQFHEGGGGGSAEHTCLSSRTLVWRGEFTAPLPQTTGKCIISPDRTAEAGLAPAWLKEQLNKVSHPRSLPIHSLPSSVRALSFRLAV